jgi:hypothetical protein
VPTLEAVLNSSIRPKYWTRDFDKPEYDYENPGWKFTMFDAPGDKLIYQYYITRLWKFMVIISEINFLLKIAKP